MYRSYDELKEEEKAELRNALWLDSYWNYQQYGDFLDEAEKEELDSLENEDDISEIIMEKVFGGICFVEEDFWCNLEETED